VYVVRAVVDCYGLIVCPFGDVFECQYFMSCRCDGKAFHTREPAAEKLVSTKLLCVRRTTYPCIVNVNANQCQSKIFNVARIEELLRSPRRRSRITELCYRKRLTKKERFKTLTEYGDDWMSDGNGSCRGAMQRLEMCVDRRL